MSRRHHRAAGRFEGAGRALALAGIAGATLAVAPVAGTASAAGGIIVSEAVYWGNGNTSYGADWFEVTNTSASAVDITGWRFDDNSNSFANSVALAGVTSIGAGESVVFIEGTAATATAFVNAWFGGTAPAGFHIGTYTGSGISFGNSGDAVNLFDAGGTLRANISFGAAMTSSPFASFDNAAGVDGGVVTTLSAAGVSGSFSIVDNANTTIASPGTIVSAPGSTTTTSTTTTTTTIVGPPTPSPIISEVAPWGSGNSSYGVDWFELTNTSGAAIDITGWKIDDSSNSFASAIALTGITSIAAGESVIFFETADPVGKQAAFIAAWFNGAAPAGLRFGSYTGSGIGLSTSGDALNLFNAAGTLRQSVTFGASPTAEPFGSFDNAAGLDGTTISTLSAVGVNGAFASLGTTQASIGSPGTATVSGPPSPTTTAAPTTTLAPGATWPGDPVVTDASGSFGGDMSGLIEDTSGVLWAVRNDPGMLYRLVWNGSAWVPDTADNWSAGKQLRYPSGTGTPDSEGVTFTDGPSTGIYVATERNGLASGVSRNAIIRVDPTAVGTELVANAEWNLTSDLPTTGANLGLEAITWVPDTDLVGQGFWDDHLNKAYDPADYPNHGTGLFFVGVEGTGAVHVYALDQAGTNFTRLTTFASGFGGVMELQFDRDLHQLWAVCDNTCNGRHTILGLTNGHYAVTALFARPAGMPDINNEGFAIAPQSTCVDGKKAAWWSDDDESGNIAIRGGTIPCTAYEAPGVEVPEVPVVVLPTLLAIGGLVVIARRRRPLAAT